MNECKLSFDAVESDGSPRKFAGMWRPPAPPHGGTVVLGERGAYYTIEQVREAWQRGEFDRPLYTPIVTSDSHSGDRG